MTATADSNRSAATTADVARIARQIYDEPRALHLHEELFLSAIAAIGRRFTSYRGTAAREYGYDSDAHKAVCAMADRQEAKELRAALDAYRRERDRFNGDYDDSEEIEAVRGAMAAE